ncbi:MAG: hypothetical protein M1825_002468 [Sarcosagium campestre]|nr:MAG: hypothetical protein M1825_002468 [Sarcosagium campestre]
MSAKLTAAILIISETAVRDHRTDRSGPALSDTFDEQGNGNWAVLETIIVTDDIAAIQHQLLQWTDCETPVNLIVTSGGTGFAVKDVTPEAVSPLLQKNATGIVHAMLSASSSITPFAYMSRPVAGVRNKSVIITLPGSPKGAQENLQSILKLLPHACQQAYGADSRALHAGGLKELERNAGVGTTPPSGQQDKGHHQGHSHCHHGHATPVAHTTHESQKISNDPQQGPTRRHRSSPYPILSVDEALRLILDNTPAPRAVTESTIDASIVGSILANDVVAQESVPAFAASIVDGYAIVKMSDGPSTKGTFPVVSVSHAAASQQSKLQPGELARITTGAPLPLGATAVVMVEDTRLISTTDDDEEEEKEVEILTDATKPGENVREAGSDVEKGDLILSKNQQITAVGGELGLLASVGVSNVSVYYRPVVGVLSTGDEIIPHDRPGPLRLGEVRDTNRPTLLTALTAAGYKTIDLGIASDSANALEATLRDALRKTDVIITTGGVSMGELDLLKPTIERSLGGTIHFGRVAMKPGKPTTFATVPFKTTSGERGSQRLIFALPGNPASAIVTLHLFVLPSLRAASGVEPPTSLPRVRVYLTHDVVPDRSRPEYHRAVVVAAHDGRLLATSTGGQRSSRVGSLASANALLCLKEGASPVVKGSAVDALLMAQIHGMQ